MIIDYISKHSLIKTMTWYDNVIHGLQKVKLRNKAICKIMIISVYVYIPCTISCGIIYM